MKKLSICFFPLLLFLVIIVSLVSCQSQKVQEMVKENEELRAKNEALKKENAELRTQNEELKEKLGKIEMVEDNRSKQIAQEGIRTLQRLEARFHAGISHRDYGPALGETIYQVRLYLENSEAKKRPELTQSIAKTLLHYEMIKEIWDEKIAGRELMRIFRGDVREKIKRLYPEISAQNVEHVDLMIKFILPKASEELGKAKNLLAQ